MIWTSQKGHMAIIQRLVAMGADLQIKDNRHRTPLLWAAGGGHCDVVRFLLKRKADLLASDKDGLSTISWAAAGPLKNSEKIAEEGCRSELV